MKVTTNPIAFRSQKELIDSLLSIMKETPYSEISIKQILIESKISRKTFYRNFDNRDDLLDAYLDILLKHYKEKLIANNDFVFTNSLKVIATFILDNKETLQLFWKNDLEYIILKKLNAFIRTYHYTICVNPSRFEDYIVMLNNGAIWNVLNEWMRTGMVDPLDEVLAFLEDYLQNIGKYDLTHLCANSSNQ